MDQTHQQFGEQIYADVAKRYTHLAGKIVGMFLEEQPLDSKLLKDPEFLNAKIDEAFELLRAAGMVGEGNALIEPEAQSVAVEPDMKMSTDEATVFINNSIVNLAETLRTKFTKLELVFRRVNEKVLTDNLERTMVYGADCQPDLHVPQSVSAADWKQYGKETCDDFRGVTSPYIKGERSSFRGQKIRFAKASFAQLNLFTLEFEPALPEQPPRVDDLLCGIVEEDETKGLRFSRWFNCSEQFYRLYTTIMSNSERDSKKWFRGNYFQTASHLKWVLAHLNSTEKESAQSGSELHFHPDSAEQKRLDEEKEECHKIFFEQESMKRFHNLRTEPQSTKWVHVYCAIAMLLKRKTLPLPDNVPKNARGPAFPNWHFPREFVMKFLISHAPSSAKQQWDF